MGYELDYPYIYRTYPVLDVLNNAYVPALIGRLRAVQPREAYPPNPEPADPEGGGVGLVEPSSPPAKRRGRKARK